MIEIIMHYLNSLLQYVPAVDYEIWELMMW